MMKNKHHAVINILGLVLGITCSLLIFIVVQEQGSTELQPENLTIQLFPSASVDFYFIQPLYLLASFVLLSVCINFINLSTALAVKRSREVGLRKMMGGNRNQLIYQFLGETTIITFFAIVISIVLVEFTLPYLNFFLSEPIQKVFISNLNVVLFLLFLFLFTTVTAGAYPALILSGYRPVIALKLNEHTEKSLYKNDQTISIRKVLVILQFVISQVLFICTWVMRNQLALLSDKDFGAFFLENVLLNIIQVFTFISFLISILGLYGLMTYMISRKEKEVGIRKVLGATSKSILRIFYEEFTKLTLVSFLLASPIAFWLTDYWLQNFVTRVAFDFEIFFTSILVSILITWITISYKSLRVANLAPTVAIRGR